MSTARRWVEKYRAQKKPISIAALHGFAVPVGGLEKLAAADGFRSLGLDRRAALWEVKALAKSKALPLFAFADTREQGEEGHVALPEMALDVTLLQGICPLPPAEAAAMVAQGGYA